MALPRIHAFYRLWFTFVDPISLVLTVKILFRDRDFFMNGFIPSTISVADPMHGFLFHGQAALYAFMGLMLGGTLRVTSEFNVWRMVIAGVFMVDVALLASQYSSIEKQGRMSLDRLRWQDWTGLGYTAGCGVIRAFFLTGVGVKMGKEEARRE